MPKFEVTVPHPLSLDESREKLQNLLGKLQEAYQDKLSDLTHEWQGDELKFSFTTFGFKIGGAMLLGDKQVKVSGDLPFAAAMFKGKIEGDIRKQLERLLS